MRIDEIPEEFWDDLQRRQVDARAHSILLWQISARQLKRLLRKCGLGLDPKEVTVLHNLLAGGVHCQP